MAAASARFVIDRNPREVFRKTHANNDTRNFEVFDDARRRCACAGRLLFWQRRSAATRRSKRVVQNCEVVNVEVNERSAFFVVPKRATSSTRTRRDHGNETSSCGDDLIRRDDSR
jgi:hypothetical protein